MDNKNKPKERSVRKEKSLCEVLTDCGRLRYDIDKTLNIVYSKFPNIDLSQLRHKLTTDLYEEYRAYHSGADLGEYEIESAMYDDAISGSKTSVDSHNTLHDLQKEKTLNDAIRDKFFPNDAD